jgi:hypothetical protein
VCYAADRSWGAEREFYSSTLHESPALFGHEAVELCYHLEAFVFFARSSLDIAAAVFGPLLLCYSAWKIGSDSISMKSAVGVSNGGLLLLRSAERELGVCRRLADAMPDRASVRSRAATRMPSTSTGCGMTR